MKFVLNRNPENRNQKIPFPAMQMAGLADAEQLTIQADAGSILISREDITARQAITTITHLYEVIDSLILQLVDASNEIVDVLDIPDPLETVDEELLDDLLECGANPDGLRLLLAVEDEADEE
ncbi:hypothetical protein LIR37_13445 [Flavonifractor plautii]|jgi:antitoxin component of MazEF toxin-antitoxin module|uniref:hypothetical protein n=1 Tax=Oscillospiraceae TaxID=216572 RepID=UPI001D0129E6|nr:hypothetical protein [Flavonifractor plautii]MCB5855369.1 hypothetical protein [Flavonifractor plautii]